jgi:two-component system, OmpR family, response regulator
MEGKTKILLVEDDVNFGAVMKDYLIMNGYSVTLARDGLKGWSSFNNDSFDICILDVMMPGKDGFSLARDIRKVNPAIPLIFLTAKALKEDVVTGYRAGADDYVTKPFDSEVLLLKIKAILGRTSGIKNVTGDQQEYEIGDYHFNHKLRILSMGEFVQKLSPREADLLQLLCVYKNDVLPREAALKKIWGEDNYFTARSMDVFITRIRKYLKEDPAVEIVNVHGNGFRLMVNSKY